MAFRGLETCSNGNETQRLSWEAMEKRLTEAQKRLNPLRRFRQVGFRASISSGLLATFEEFEQKAAAKKALQEIQNKLNSAELEIEKAHIMTSAETQMEQARAKPFGA